jgi:hypothetical protein
MISLRSVFGRILILILFSIDIRCCLIILQQSLPDLLITGTLLPISKVIVRLQDDFGRYKQTVPLLTMIK